MPARLSRIKPQLSSLLPHLSLLLIPSLSALKEREPPLSTTPGLNIWPGNRLCFLLSLMMPQRKGRLPQRGCCSHRQEAFQGQQKPPAADGEQDKRNLWYQWDKTPKLSPTFLLPAALRGTNLPVPGGTHFQGGMPGASRQGLETEAGRKNKACTTEGRLQSISYPC